MHRANNMNAARKIQASLRSEGRIGVKIKPLKGKNAGKYAVTNGRRITIKKGSLAWQQGYRTKDFRRP